MHLSNLFAALLFLTPALSSPAPSNMNCDSLLSFDEAGQHSIVSIRAFCNRRKQKAAKASIAKRSVTSVFDLPAARTEQQANSPRVAIPHYIAEKENLDPAVISSSFDAADLQTVTTSQGRQCHSTFAQRMSHFFSHHAASAAGEFRHRTHGLLMTVNGMTSNLLVAGFVAVFFVVAVLLASERWLGARLRWSRLTTTPPPPSYPIDGKIPIIIVGAVDEKAAIR